MALSLLLGIAATYIVGVLGNNGDLICKDPTTYNGSAIYYTSTNSSSTMTCDTAINNFLISGYEFNATFCSATTAPKWTTLFWYYVGLFAEKCCSLTSGSICDPTNHSICLTPSQFSGTSVTTGSGVFAEPKSCNYADLYMHHTYAGLSCNDSDFRFSLNRFGNDCCADMKSACWVDQSDFCLNAGMYNYSLVIEEFPHYYVSCDSFLADRLLDPFTKVLYDISTLNCTDDAASWVLAFLPYGKQCCQDLKWKCFVDHSAFCYNATAFQPFVDFDGGRDCTYKVESKKLDTMDCFQPHGYNASEGDWTWPLQAFDAGLVADKCCSDKKMKCWQDFSPICQNPASYQPAAPADLVAYTLEAKVLMMDTSTDSSSSNLSDFSESSSSSSSGEGYTCDTVSMLFAAVFNITNFSNLSCNMDDTSLVVISTYLATVCCADKIAACKIDYSDICPVNTTYSSSAKPYDPVLNALLFEKFCPTCAHKHNGSGMDSLITCDLYFSQYDEYAESMVDPTQECGGLTDLNDQIKYASAAATCCTNDDASVTTPPMSRCALNETLPAQLCLVASNYNKHAMIDLGSNKSIDCHSGFYAWFGMLSRVETVFFRPRQCNFPQTQEAIDMFAASCCGAGGISVCHPSSSPSPSHSPSSNSTGASSSPSTSFSPTMSASKSMESASKSIQKASNGSSGLIPGGMLISFLLFSLGFLFNFL
eukprot:gb/GEZN01002417.1/.p1 GENE.gb/GEZN01002417.1/~~gb/GEZN01002417.1/.p1  ORF type:complete len:706 (-),score=41.13 gb/GEZN01002417.1/:311-2428(-)